MSGMGSTVVVVDTNLLVESPRLQRAEWVSLIEHATDWDVRIVVPEVVVMETVNKVTGAWNDTSADLAKLKLGAFDVAHHVGAITSTITEHCEGYEDWLREHCADNGITIVSPPVIDAMDIARRASEGRAPYHRSKDGFRDTLIWLTVISVAQEADAADVWLVSQNTADFGAKVTSSDESDLQHPLHDDLVQELREHGLDGRVRYVPSLKRLEQHLAAQFAPILDDALAEHTAGIDKATLAAKLVLAVVGLEVEPEATALPIEVVSAQVVGAREPLDGWQFTEAARRGQAGWTARFSVDVETDLLLVGSPLVSSEHTKMLRTEGQVSIAPDGGVIDLVVDSVEALPDDPMRERWTRRSARTTSYGSQIPGLLKQNGELLRTIAGIQETLQSQPYQNFLRAQQETQAKMVRDAVGISRVAESFKAQQDEILKNVQGSLAVKAQMEDAATSLRETIEKQMRPAYDVINAFSKSSAMEAIRSLSLAPNNPLSGLPNPKKKADSEEGEEDTDDG